MTIPRFSARRLLIASLGVAASVVARASPQDWGFVRAIGGMRVGEAVQTNGIWRLPVHANVSGVETITERPTLQNARLQCAAVTAVTEGQRIYLTIETTLQNFGGGSARCRTAVLGHPAPGIYRVFYRSPNGPPVRLREVHISP